MISFALITRNCADTLPACLASIKSIADEIIVVDTDSTDNTREIAASFGAHVIHVDRFRHPDKFLDIPDGRGGTEVSLSDFAWARNLSFDAAKGNLIFCLDADDTLEGLDHWYEMLRRFETENVDAVLLPYEYARDDRGTVITTLWRERLVKNTPEWRWEGVVHEVLPAEGRPVATYEHVRIVHHKDLRKHPILKRRNLEILLRKGDRSLPRTWFYLGVEHTYNGDHKSAAEAFEHYLTISTSEEETYQALFYLGDLHRVNDRWEAALGYYQKAIAVRPTWRDAYFGMAMAFGHAKDWDRCLYYVHQGRQQPPAPNTLLTYNPRHEILGWVEWAVTAYRNKGDVEGAWQAVQDGLAGEPHNPIFLALQRELLPERERLQTTRSASEVVSHLLRHGETIEALRLADTLHLPSTPEIAEARTRRHLAVTGRLPGRSLRVARLDYFSPPTCLEWIWNCLCQEPVKPHVAIPGCGESVTARIFYYHGQLQVTAWDPDGSLVQAINAVGEMAVDHAPFRVQHASVDTAPSVPPDAVLLEHVLEYMAHPEQLVDAAMDWLKPGGRLLCIVPHGTTAGNGQVLSPWTPDRLRRMTRSVTPPTHVSDPQGGPGWLCLEVRKPRRERILPREISIVCPPALEAWGPWSLEKGIGGSEEAVIQMARALARRGHTVRIYNDWVGADVGPDYEIPYDRVREYRRADVCIAWRSPEMFTGRKVPDAEWLWVWLHDMIEPERVLAAYPRVDAFLVGSNFHASLYPQAFSKMAVVRLGLAPHEFVVDKLQRQVHRFVWTSCPTRGLETLLDFWPQIRREVPDAELRVFYDFINLDTMLASSDPTKEPDSYKRLREMRPRILAKAKQDGVEWCGRVGHGQIAKEMLQAGVWAYPTNFPESMCISAAKMQRSGVWPVFYPFAALPETIAWGWQSTPENFVQHCVEACLGEKPESERQAMQDWAAKCYSWENTALAWERILQGE